jgi:Holliday junction DNA helicase RuvB
MGVNIKITSGPALERSGDLASILTNLEENDILFIDEIHRLNKVVEETLYPAMEDFAIDIVVGKGPSARTLRLDLPRFTIVGATTRIGLLSSPLRDRFGVTHRLSFYQPDELIFIIKRASQKLKIPIDQPSVKELAIRARGTPRIALKLLKRARDMAQVKGEGTITEAVLKETFQLLEVDPLGLDESDRRLILAIIEKHDGGPVGIETLSASISEDTGTVEEVLEPYLMQIGFLKRTPRGRVATQKAYWHLGKKMPEEK